VHQPLPQRSVLGMLGRWQWCCVGFPVCEEGNQEQRDWNYLGCTGRGTSVGEGEHLDALCICVLDGAWIWVEPVGGFMPFDSIKLDELWGSHPGAVVVEGEEVPFVFMLKPEGCHKFFHPMQDAYSVSVCIDGEQGEWCRLFADLLDTVRPVELRFFGEPCFIELCGHFGGLNKASARATSTACFGEFSLIGEGWEY